MKKTLFSYYCRLTMKIGKYDFDKNEVQIEEKNCQSNDLNEKIEASLKRPKDESQAD